MLGSDAPPRKRSFPLRETLGYGLVAGAVWLGWETIKAPVVERGAPAISVRLAPTSPEVLRRAAEAELLAERFENAESLAAESLGRAPFNARALRVRGLSRAALGDNESADQILTLAGNWSLRDDPTHAWLIERRLRRGDYQSAFAHADTLARRRADLYPSLFRLFTTAASQDPRALPVITSLVARRPPWRSAYLDHLHKTQNGAPVIGGLAIALEHTEGPFTTEELGQLYTEWLKAGRLQGIKEIRARLGRPGSEQLLQNGDFSVSVSEQAYPFGWSLGSGAGIVATVVEDDLNSNNEAYRLEYDGYQSGVMLAQLLLLLPGKYLLEGELRVEAQIEDIRLQWTVACAETEDETVIFRPQPAGSDTAWRSFSAAFEIPQENCSAQWLRLMARPDDHRQGIAVWFDNLRLRRISG